MQDFAAWPGCRYPMGDKAAAWPGNSCRMANDATGGVGNSSAQTVDDHVLVNGRTRKRSAAGGWSEAEVCAEELPLRGRPCMEDNAAASGSSLGSGKWEV